MSRKSTLRVFPYLISQYLFFLVIVLGFGISSQSTSKHVTDERYCSASNGSNFDEQYDPDYFYHLTDVHVTHYNKDTQDIFEQSLNIGSSYKPKSVLITGDLVDNYFLPYDYNDAQETKQMEEDWEEYHKVASKFTNKFEKIIESFGNHDIPRILSHDSHNFFYNKYSMISQSHHNFSLPNDTYDVFTEKVGNFTFLVLNPIFFPIPPLPFTYYVHAPTEYIEKVERIIDSIPSDENVILATHFQGPVWSESYCPFVKSLSTERFFKSILQNKKVKMLLTGHNHGAGRMVMHYGDSFEVCASDLRENKRSGLVTNDNGNVVYHWLTIHNATKTFVTFPSPVEQTTSRTDCGVPKVRAITFDKNDKFVEIDGKRLKLNRMRKLSKDGDAWLLEANVSFLAKGRHHLKLSGEEEEEFEFIFGRSSKIESVTELLYDDMLWAHGQWIGLIILIVVFMFVTFPISLFERCAFDGYWRWINGMDDERKEGGKLLIKQAGSESKSEEKQKMNSNNSKSFHFLSTDIEYYFFTVFFGFFGIRSRLLKLPFMMRLLLFVSVVASLFLPIFTFDVDGTYGFMFMFGYYLSHGSGMPAKYADSSSGDHYISRLYQALDLRYEVWCPFLGFYYFAVAVVPVILSASALGLKPAAEGESRIQLIDLAVQLGAIVGGFIISFDSFLLLCERKCAWLSPFIQFPIVFLSIFSLFFIQRKMKRNRNLRWNVKIASQKIDNANTAEAHTICSC